MQKANKDSTLFMHDNNPPSVLAKQVDLLYQSLPSALIASALIPILFLVLITNFPEPEALWSWVMLMLLIILFRSLTVVHYNRSKQRGTVQVKQAEVLFIAGIVLSGMAWGSLSWWIYPLTNDQSTHFLFFISVIGVSGGSVASLGYRRLPGYLFIILSLAPMYIGLYRTPADTNGAIALISFVYTIFLLKNIRFFAKNNKKLLLLEQKAIIREAKLKVASEKAQAASQAKSRFLANMSHEIRTPMNSIIGQTRLALDEKYGPKLQLHLDIIYNSSENLLALINDILDFSKIEAGELKIDNKPFDLHATLYSIFETIQVLAEDKTELKLTYTIAPDVPQAINGDKQRLRQILLNLLSNSVKFTENGFINLSVERLKTADDSLQLKFVIRDSGIGIALKKQKYIFNEFAQEDDSSTRKFGGTGLGLAISQQLCQLMGGDIEVSSIPAKGSTFSFSIPFRTCHPSELPTADSSRIKKTQMHSLPLSLLIVEDNEANRILARMVLEGEHHRLMEAHNGLQALKLLAEYTFDAVLMDVQMPLMDGFTTTKIIRSAETGNPAIKVDKQLDAKLSARLYGCHTPIIAMTANAMSGDKEKCMAAGMDDYLAKPFHPDGLAAILKKLAISSSGQK